MKRFYIYLFAAFCTVFLGACTGNFRDMNDDLTGISDEDLEADDNGFGYRLQIVQQGIYFNYDFGKGKNWPFQMTQNLNADMFSGYMHDPKPLQGGSHNSDYNLQDSWNSAMWQFTYSYVMPQIYRLEQTAREKMPPFYAITKILKVLAMHRVTDYYGPVIYSHFADRGSEYVPDSQQQAYNCFFDDLDEAADILAAWVEEQPEAGEFSRFDLLLDGSYTAWLRFANSLRMRLAVRIAVAAPEKARAGIPEGGAGGRRGDRDQYGECRREDLGHLFQSVGRDQPELERGGHERFDGIRTDRVRGSAAGEVFQALRQRPGHCRRCGRRDGRPEGAIPWNPSGDGVLA